MFNGFNIFKYIFHGLFYGHWSFTDFGNFPLRNKNVFYEVNNLYFNCNY